MLWLTLTYFVPIMAFWYQGYADFVKDGGRSDPDFQFLNIFSIGIFIYDPVTTVGIRYYTPEEGANELKWVGRFLGLTVFVNLLMLVWVRRRLLQMSVELDLKTYTNSDFALMGENMRFDDYTHEGMLNAVREHFKNWYDIPEEDIVYITPAFDIDEFYTITEEYNEYKQKRALIDRFMDE